jgi:hypothetical protein
MTSLMRLLCRQGDALAQDDEGMVISGERNLLNVQDLSSNMAHCVQCSICLSRKPA